MVGADEARFVAVLNRAVGDRDAEVRFPRAARPTEDRVLPLGDELGPQVAAQHLELERGPEGEVEVVDRAQKGEACFAHGAREARLRAVGDLLDDERFEIGVVAHAQHGDSSELVH